MASKSYSKSGSSGFQLEGTTTQTTGKYYFGGSPQNDTINIEVDFSEIPTTAQIQSVELTWGAPSSSTLSFSLVSRDFDSEKLKNTLSSGARKAVFQTNANVSWAPFGDSRYRWVQWSTSIAITITYLEGASINVSATSIDIGGSISADISNWTDAIAKTKVTWQIYSGSEWLTVSGPTEYTSAPTSAISQSYLLTNSNVQSALSNSTSQQGRVVIESFDSDNNNLGTQISEFTINIPDTDAYKPTNSFAATPILISGLSWKTSGVTAFYPYYTKMQVVVTAAAQGGSTLSESGITVTYGALGLSYVSKSGSNYTFQATLTESGSNTLTVKVTDSRGRTTTATETIEIVAIDNITISGIKCTRAEDADTGGLKASSTGTHAIVGYTATYPGTTSDSVKFKGNALTSATLKLYEGSYTATPIEKTVSTAATQSLSLTDTFNGDSVYYVTLTLKDRARTAVFTLGTLDKIHCNMHLAGSGYGVGVGAFVEDADSSNPVFRCGYPMELKLGNQYYKIRIGTSGAEGYITIVV